MGLFYRFKKREQKANNEVENNAVKNSNTAVSYAKSFKKHFNYSKKSINDLEEILDYYSNDISKSNPTENQIWSMAVIFGSYLGEVMLKNGLAEKGYKWAKDGSSNIPLLADENGSFITPNDKVYKRLVNGKEDSIISFYDVMMDCNK
ncbi:hypothetical protein [Ruminococcus sp. Marseille-P6503]|uniref:hypothetical protein n=1 Tax=Ruminococcus sp. Marseille-P6503 TaxID=2364796 RepID=UPI000F540471|nr:hypothetical protein [Ruminococcus sp. Marseille-P6503]